MKNKILSKIFLSICLCFTYFGNVQAGEVESTVTLIQANNASVAGAFAGVEFTDLPTNQPACATDPNGRMVYQSSRLVNGVSISNLLNTLLLTSLLEGRTIKVVGTGECIVGYEIISYAVLR